MTTTTVDSPLGQWTFDECRPDHLRGLVDFMWLFDGTMTCLRERTFPHGLLEIIVHLGVRYSVVEERSTWKCSTTCVTGLQLGPLVIQAPAHRTKVLGIRLTPEGAYALFGRPMHEVTRLTVDLDDLVGAAAAELADQCFAASTADACFGAAIRWIDARLARTVRTDPVVAWTLRQIRRRAGMVSIGALREQTGFSKTRLAELFQAQAGVTPKQYARLIRFRNVLDRIHAGEVALADAAHEAGYYDQPHMNAEFKELSGFTPSQFLASERYPNSVSVADR
jgi:AraC-like DNA-binding protein